MDGKTGHGKSKKADEGCSGSEDCIQRREGDAFYESVPGNMKVIRT